MATTAYIPRPTVAVSSLSSPLRPATQGGGAAGRERVFLREVADAMTAWKLADKPRKR